MNQTESMQNPSSFDQDGGDIGSALDLMCAAVRENKRVSAGVHFDLHDMGARWGGGTSVLRDGLTDELLKLHLHIRECQLKAINPFARPEAMAPEDNVYSALSDMTLAAYKALVYGEVPEHDQFIRDIEDAVTRYRGCRLTLGIADPAEELEEEPSHAMSR